MARYKLPKVSEIWKRHENLYIGIFILALDILAKSSCDVSNENKISATLNPILQRVCFEEATKRNCSIPLPVWEGSIPPINESELKHKKFGKRPDFTCNLVNHMVHKLDDYVLPFHVECKKLGAPVSKGWIFNKNYVTEGIAQYDMTRINIDMVIVLSPD